MMHLYLCDMMRQSKEGGTAEGLPPARSLTALESFPLRYLAGAEVRTDGEEP